MRTAFFYIAVIDEFFPEEKFSPQRGNRSSSSNDATEWHSRKYSWAEDASPGGFVLLVLRNPFVWFPFFMQMTPDATPLAGPKSERRRGGRIDSCVTFRNRAETGSNMYILNNGWNVLICLTLGGKSEFPCWQSVSRKGNCHFTPICQFGGANRSELVGKEKELVLYRPNSGEAVKNWTTFEYALRWRGALELAC